MRVFDRSARERNPRLNRSWQCALITLSQSPGAFCRNRRAVGYQGESSRSEHPAPVGLERQQHPNRPAHGAGKMHHGRIDGNDKIDERDNGSGIVEFGKIGADRRLDSKTPRCAPHRRRASRAEC